MTETAPRPLVSVVIPARNEEADIVGALEAVKAQDYPLDRIELLVVDGASTDNTAAVVKEYVSALPFFGAEVLSNPIATTPTNLNTGLAAATGEYLCRVDARSEIPTNYIGTCVAVLAGDPDIAVVGGAQIAVPPTADSRGVGIARALNNPYGMGGSRYRRGASSGFADTVYLGFFRTEQLRGVGGWNVDFPTNQDFELNRRMAAEAGRIWFDDRLAVRYTPRSTHQALFSQYRRFGRWKVHYWRTTGNRPQPRQWVLLSAPILAGVAGLTFAFVSRRRPALLAAGAVAGVAVARAVERSSAGPEATGWASRLHQLRALAAVASGWELGVLESGAGRQTIEQHRPGR